MIALHDRIRVHVRGEWVAVEVTRLPDAECASWSGHSDDGRLVTWDASHEVEAVQEHGWLERSLASASAEVAKWTREKQEAMRVHPGGADLDTTLAALEGALAGWRTRALLAEAEREDAFDEGWDAGAAISDPAFVDVLSHDALAMIWGGDLSDLYDGCQRSQARWMQRATELRAEVLRLRDQLAIARHQGELARDVLRAVADQLSYPSEGGARKLRAAATAWYQAGRPGLGGER